MTLATILLDESRTLTIVPGIPWPLEFTTLPTSGSGFALNVASKALTLVARTAAGLKVAPPVAQQAIEMCLPLCAEIWLSKALSVLVADWMSPALIEACADASLLVKALEIPELSIPPAAVIWLMTLVTLDESALTVTLTLVEWVSVPTLPVAVRVKVDGVTAGERLRFNVEEAVPPPGGVTGVVLKDAVTPAGIPVTVSATGELKPNKELTATWPVPVPPTKSVTGGITFSEKSLTVMTFESPVIDAVAVSIAVIVWLPAVFSVAVNVCVPLSTGGSLK